MKILKPNEINIKNTYYVMIYGKPGIGKTTVALSAQNPLLIDCEDGIERVDSDFWEDVARVESYMDIYGLLQDNLSGYDTIIFDSVASLNKLMISHILRKNPKAAMNGQLTLKGYGELNSLCNIFLSLVRNLNKNLIFVAHEIESENILGDKTVRPNIGQGSGFKPLIEMMDAIGFMHKKNNKTVITFDCPEDDIMTKNALGLDKEFVVHNPSITHANTFIEDNIAKAKKNMSEKIKQKRLAFEEIDKKIKNIINTIVDADTCNNAYRTLSVDYQDEQHIMMWRKALNDKTKILNLQFNKKTGGFENAHATANA